jgi:hypothetical protein
MLGKLDHEIRDTELRIAHERQMLVGSLQHTGHQVRETLISPRALAVFAAAGFVLGDFMRSRRRRGRERAQQAKTIKSSLFGLLLSGALALVKARYGSPWGLASAVLQKTNGRRRASGAGEEASRRTEADRTGTAPPGYRGNGADPPRSARVA